MHAMQNKEVIKSPVAAVVISLDVKAGDKVRKGDVLVTLEAMKVETQVKAPVTGRIGQMFTSEGQTLQKDAVLMDLVLDASAESADAGSVEQAVAHTNASDDRVLNDYRQRINQTLDAGREADVAKRHARGYRTARENLTDLIDHGTFVEYGQMAVAAQRGRRDYEELKTRTAADGIITGTATINADRFDGTDTNAAVVINDYSVLAGTQGYFHHHKLDRLLSVAKQRQLPVVMFTEGGGGRPGDTDVQVQIGGLHLMTWVAWSELCGEVPRIAVANGYCFAGNAALFGGADIRIATRNSWIGMAGPAMIEGGGLGSFKPTEIGPIDVQSKNGVVDIVADDEAHATRLAKDLLGYFQGPVNSWQCAEQSSLWGLMPEDRRYTYDVRKIITTLADSQSFIELGQAYGGGIITGFMRLEGKPFAVICNDCKVLGGAIDAEAAEKAANFINLCSSFELPLVSLCDTPGFMVGPDSEAQGSAKKMAAMFSAGAKMKAPIVTIFLRKAYGLGAMAMAGGSFARSIFSAAWPSGEFGAMGLEGAVRLGYKKELEAAAEDKGNEAKEAMFDELVAQQYELGKATEAASYLEIDGVIDPADTRQVILRAV